MVAISTPAAVVQTRPPATQPALAPTTAAAPGANDPVDTVTLSPQAQDILDGRAAAPSAPQGPPSRDQIAAAIAALNDTSGKSAVGDQLNAYALLTNVLAKGQVLLDNRLPPATSPPGGMMSEAAAQAALVSSFSQRLNQVVAKVDRQRDPAAKDDGADPTTFTGPAAKAFDALSADDQQIYVAAKTLSKSLGAEDNPGAQPPAGYSPPDVKVITDALAKVDDPSGGVMAKDQAAALDLLNGYAAAGGGPAAQAVAMNAAASPFAVRRAQTQTLVEKYLVPGKDPYPQMLDNLNKLSPEDQGTYFSTRSKAADGTVLFSSLGSLKDNLTTRETMLKVYTAVTEAYGFPDLAHFTTRAAKDNPALKQLEALFRMDQESDGWTAMAQDFLSRMTPADLGLAPVNADGDPDMAKAMQTLKEVAANQTAFVLAAKTGHLQDWQAVKEAKKASDKADADLNGPATGMAA